jgi:hypothetical protein
MILGEMVGAAAENPGSNAARQGVTYALENRRRSVPTGSSRRRSQAESDVGDVDQGVTVPGVVFGWEPRWEPHGRTTFRSFGLTRTADRIAAEVTD